MNRASTFTLSPRIEDAYNAAQDFIANECPVLEQRLKRAALKATIAICEFLLTVIDWAKAEIDKALEYSLRAQLAYALSKRWFVRRAIAVARFDERYQVTAKASKVWTRKGAIATSAMDKVFSLN